MPIRQSVLLHTKVGIQNTKEIHLIYYTNHVDSETSQHSDDNFIIPLAAGVITTVLILLVATVVLAILLLLWYKKNTQKTKIKSNLDNQDGLYSTLDRETKPQSQSQCAFTDDYDEIQLSPSTGQSEPISEQTENKNIVVSSVQLDCQNMQKTQSDNEKSNFATYAVVDKKKKNQCTSTKEESSESRNNTSEKGITLNSRASVEAVVPVESDREDSAKYQQGVKIENPEEMYAVVQKKPNKREEQEEIAPPVPLHTTESLYTAVEKKPKH